MKKFYLLINTVNQNYASFAVFTSEGVVLYLCGFIDKQERLNIELASFLKRAKLKPGGIDGVMVINGPGSFSGSRAGIVLANSFNFLYKIPVLGVKDACPVRGDISNASNGAGAGIENLIRDNLVKLKHAKKDAAAEVYYQKPPNITVK